VKLIIVATHEHTNFEENQSDKFDNRGGSYYGSGGRGGGYGAAAAGSFSGGRGGRGGGFKGDRDGGRRQGGAGYGNTVHLSDFVTHDNKYKSLKMRGLPYSVQVRDIRDFFNDFRVADRDIIIDMNNGRQTGYALVFFESESEATRAKESLNKKYLGNSNRYVDLNFPDAK